MQTNLAMMRNLMDPLLRGARRACATSACCRGPRPTARTCTRWRFRRGRTRRAIRTRTSTGCRRTTSAAAAPARPGLHHLAPAGGVRRRDRRGDEPDPDHRRLRRDLPRAWPAVRLPRRARPRHRGGRRRPDRRGAGLGGRRARRRRTRPSTSPTATSSSGRTSGRRSLARWASNRRSAHPVRLSEFLPAHAEVWDRIVGAHGLKPIRMADLVGQSHHYADFLFAWGREGPLAAGRWSAPSSCARPGFGDCIDTEGCSEVVPALIPASPSRSGAGPLAACPDDEDVGCRRVLGRAPPRAHRPDRFQGVAADHVVGLVEVDGRVAVRGGEGEALAELRRRDAAAAARWRRARRP